MRRTIGLTVIAVLTTVTSASAQYFGQNRVRYRDFDFSIIETEHFEVYYYDDVRDAALDASRLIERAYARLSRTLNHQYRERQPVILFASHSEFQQNNLTAISEGVQGVTDPFRHRIMLPFTGTFEDFDHVLQHELVHQFQFDIFARGRVGGGIPRLMAVQPPLWLMEGMAEYLSIGPVNAITAMWLRDAALEGDLPTIHQLTTDPRIFPYRFGHALMSYIGNRWGDAAVAEILHAVATSGLEPGFRRALGVSLETLSDDWHDDIRRTYLPEIADRDRLRTYAYPVLSRRRSKGGLHVSPILSPDGTEIAYFSEGGSMFIDLYLADVETGRIKRQLVKSAFSANFESLRFITSAGDWSPDGRFFAFPAQRGGRDDLVIFDLERNRVHRRLTVEVAGIKNPTWAPDGRRLAFTGLVGGFSDLFVINVDGSGLERLTHDRFAELDPAWSPSGGTIAMATDRGVGSDFANLRPGPLSIALYDLEAQTIEVLPAMEGTNINPQWSPDGTAVAFVSDRTGTTNVFLYETAERRVYQLTNVFTGISGITATSPAISWAQGADRLAFTHYQDGEYDVYAIDRPRSLKREPYESLRAGELIAASTPAVFQRDSTVAGPNGAVTAIDDLRARASLPDRLPSASDLLRFGTDDPGVARRPRNRSVRALLDSATLALPDTAGFGFRKYYPTLHVDYVVQPTVGYQRDNFGQGFFGGTAIALSDMLGHRRVVLGGQINGRIEEAQVLATYANLAHRTNWAIGYQQDPYFFFSGADVSANASGDVVLNQRLQRFVVHRAFFEAYRPFNRFSRLEYRLNATNVSRAELNFQTLYDPATGFGFDQDLDKTGLGSVSYLQPAVALVHDNAVQLWVGPVAGRRSRFEYAPAVGGWRFHQTLVDYRRYDQTVGPFTLATRALFFGRFGRDSDQFPLFIGTPDLLRGYTAGSYRRRECAVNANQAVRGGCSSLNQLVGTRVGVVNAEVRFPLINQLVLGALPVGFPPIEGAVFFDAGLAWDGVTQLTLNREPTDDHAIVRSPLTSVGFSIRGNVLGFIILRLDHARPLNRELNAPLWTLSLGPTF